MANEQDNALGIAELAERAEVTPRTVRYYVSEGLLPPPGGAGQQRVYNTGHLLRLKAIKRLKERFLPLGEIRQRLASASPAEVEALAEALAPAPSSALDYINAALSASQSLREPPSRYAAPNPSPVAPAGPAPWPTVPAQQAPRPATPTQPAPWPAARAPQTGKPQALSTSTPAPAAASAPAGTAWQRVTLAPDVELHYQPTGDPARDAAIARLVAEATTLLSTSSPQPSTQDSIGDTPNP